MKRRLSFGFKFVATSASLGALVLGLAVTPAYATFLVVAGGGGGAGFYSTNGGNGQSTADGQSGFGTLGGAGGTGGTGGAGGANSIVGANGGGGGGIAGTGGDGVGLGPTPGPGGSGNGGFGSPSFAGGAGGGQGDGGPAAGVTGGFGGGGGGGYAGGGGGGGYSGGGGGDGASAGGGGGGSFVDPSALSITLTAGTNFGDGSVSIGAVTFSYTGAVQFYLIPLIGLYDIQAFGGEGGPTINAVGGLGAFAEGTFQLSAGTLLDIFVGGMGVSGNFGSIWGGSGGGGSFVFATSVPTSVPEPGTLSILALGLLGLAAARYRWRHHSRVRG